MQLKLEKIKRIINASEAPRSRGRRGGPSVNERVSKLSHYSPWLENFSDNVTNLYLEIPGQYDGNRRPLLQYHVKICGFSSEVNKFKENSLIIVIKKCKKKTKQFNLGRNLFSCVIKFKVSIKYVANKSFLY